MASQPPPPPPPPSQNELDKELYAAAKYGQFEAIQELLARRANVDYVDSFPTIEESPLHQAVFNGHHQCVELLLDRQANVNIAATTSKSTPLHIAAFCNEPRCAEILIDRGADKSLKDRRGNTPEQDADTPEMALLIRNRERLELVVDRSLALGGGRTRVYVSKQTRFDELKQAIYHQCHITPTTPIQLVHNLSKVLEYQDDQTIEAMGIAASPFLYLTLQVGGLESRPAPEPPVPPENAGQLLYSASKQGDAERVRQLVLGGAPVSFTSNDDRQTPLFVAAQGNHHEIVSILLDFGAASPQVRSVHWLRSIFGSTNGMHHDRDRILEVIVDRSRMGVTEEPRLRMFSRSRATVKDLQSSIASKIGIEPDQQYLEFGDPSQILSERPNDTLTALGISDFSVIWLDVRETIQEAKCRARAAEARATEAEAQGQQALARAILAETRANQVLAREAAAIQLQQALEQAAESMAQETAAKIGLAKEQDLCQRLSRQLRGTTRRLALAEQALRRERNESFEQRFMSAACRQSNEFQVSRVLGRGDFGMVAQVACTTPGFLWREKHYALKVCFNFDLDSTQARNAYINEFIELVKLPSHPNIIRFLCEFVDEIRHNIRPHLPEFARERAVIRHQDGSSANRKTQFFVVEFIHMSLARLLVERFAPPSIVPHRIVATIISQVGSALRHLDHHRLAHRDIKIDNIMVEIQVNETTNEVEITRCVLIDFGTSCRLNEQMRSTTLVSDTGVVLGPHWGNAAHVAPELHSALRSATRANQRQEVELDYSRQSVFELGVLGFEIVNGVHPLTQYPSTTDSHPISYLDQDIAPISSKRLASQQALMLRRAVSCDPSLRPSLDDLIQCFDPIGELRLAKHR